MAIITENGTGLSTAETLVSVADCSAYHLARGNNNWATITTAQMEEALRRASDYMLQVYSLKWAGYRKNSTQALDWPRYNVPYIRGINVFSANYDSDSVPQLVKNAACELAFKAAQGELAPDVTQTVVSEKVDVLEVVYDKNSPQYAQFRAIDNLLAPFLKSGTSGAFRATVRT